MKYSALVGPGPTGCRPEHFRDMLSVPRRADANRLLRALSTFHKCIDSGSLPDACRFITRTRLMWQRKKNGKPRPIKMGEVLRSCYAKHLVHKHRVKLRTTCLSMHQWGIGLPGAAEALSHWRGTIEELICDGTLEPMVAADLDLVNMFGNAEWPSIRSAIQSHFEEALPWTKWHHEQPSTTVLPCKTDFDTDRGAEQGDVLGSIQSSLTLGAARSQHFARVGDHTFYPGARDE